MRSISCVHELVATQVARRPDALAAVYGGAELTYRQLDTRADRLAALLRGHGVGPEVVVGVCAERSLEWLTGLLAVWKAGGVYLPLDPEYPRDRLAFIASDAGACLLMGKDNARSILPSGARFVDLGDGSSPARTGSKPAIHPDNLAYIIYTSGSTGTPKGVMVGHGSLSGYASGMRAAYAMRPDDRVLQFASTSFDASIEDVVLTLTAGATLVLRSDDMLDPGPAFFDHCSRLQLSVLNVPTAFWHQLVDTLSDRMASLPCSVRLVLVGGESAAPERVARWLDLVEPRVRLVNGYGPAEATIAATSWVAGALPFGSTGEAVVPIGRPVAGAEVHVVDGVDGLAPAGVPGEVFIGGPGVARGYVKAPRLTAERFVPDPFSGRAGARIYRTSDRARTLPDSNLEFLGRLDDQVKIRGRRIEPGEIESTLLGHPDIRGAAVARVDGAVGDRRLVAYLVSSRPVAVGQLSDWLRARLPEFLVPSDFVMVDRLPLTPNGKIDRGALPPPPPRSRSHLANDYQAPSTPAQRALAAIFAELLGLERVGVTDSFFDLGGHSLTAGQMTARIRQHLGVELPATQVFLTPTIAELAAVLAQPRRSAPEVPPLVPVPHGEPLPLSCGQEAIWLLGQLAPDSIAYNTQFAVRFFGSLDVAALERTLAEIVRRHELLRTTFQEVDGAPVQVVQEPWRVTLAVTDLSGLPPAARQDRVSRIAAELNTSFDVTRLPLLRWRLLRLADDEHLLIQVEHHFVHDGWSIGVLMRELRDIYRAFAAGEPSPLPELPVQFADFAVWQRNLLEEGGLNSQLGYWRRQLSGDLPRLTLFDAPQRTAMPGFKGAMTAVELSRRVCDRLTDLGRGARATLFMTCLAVFFTVCRIFSGQDDVVIGSSVANRRHRESERLIGMFVNPIVLRVDLARDPTFREILLRVREVVLDAMDNGDVPFERVVRAVRPPHDASRNPLFQIAFGFHDSPTPKLVFPRLAGRLEYLTNDSAKFDLNVTGIEVPFEPRTPNEHGGFVLEWEFNTDVFDYEQIEQLTSAYRAAVHRVLERPDIKLSELAELVLAEAGVRRSRTDSARARGDGTPVERDSRPSLPNAYAAPQTPLEEALASIFAELLELDRIGVTDNFFDLGGYSLLLGRAAARISEEFGVRMPLRAVFEKPMVRALASVLEAMIEPR